MGTTSGGATWGATNLGGDALFNTVAYANSSQGYTIDLTGLDAGKSYQLQFLFADPRGGSYPYTGTASVSDNLTPTPNTASATVSYGKTAVGDEFAMLTAVVSGSTSFKFNSPNQGTGGPVLSGLVVHSFAPLAGQPTSTNDSRTLAEDTQALLATDDFGSYSDPNSQPLAAVKITTLPSKGSLEYDTTGAGAWADGTFANGNLSDKTPSGNPDSDGLTNQQEFAFGLDPTTGASSNPISQQLNKGTRTFKYTRTKASGLTYNYQYSTTLSAPWVSFMSATTPPPASLSTTVEEVTVEVPAALITANPNTLFVRVKAE